jgi:hypothetical protein
MRRTGRREAGLSRSATAASSRKRRRSSADAAASAVVAFPAARVRTYMRDSPAASKSSAVTVSI